MLFKVTSNFRLRFLADIAVVFVGGKSVFGVLHIVSVLTVQKKTLLVFS